MKAITYTKYGPPDVLELKELEKPTPKDNEVLVKVHAASLNSWDLALLLGTSQGRLGAWRKPMYKILGADIAGSVEAVGSSVKKFQPGDEVFGDLCACAWGGFAEYVCARENALALKPAAMTFEEAAAVPQSAVMALQGIRDYGKIQQGQKVLINGAGGCVGPFAVQIAKSFGAEVTGIDSAVKLEMLLSIGADHVIDYTKEDFTKNGQHYDLILDLVGSRSIFDNKQSLSPMGMYAIVGGPNARILQVLFFGKWLSLTGSKKMRLLAHKPNKDLAFLKELFKAGKLASVIDRTYPLSDTAEAFQYYGEGQAKGKVVITVQT